MFGFSKTIEFGLSMNPLVYPRAYMQVAFVFENLHFLDRYSH